MIEKLSFGEPFLETHYLENENAFTISGCCLLMNLDTEKSVLAENEFSVPPLSAAKLCDAQIDVPGKALLVFGSDTVDLNDLLTLDCLRSAWKSNWELTHLDKHRGVPYYKSPRVTVGGVTMNFCLVADPDCPSGIHREHGKPVKELHMQVVGEGAVDLLRSEHPSTVFASLPLSAGTVHIPEWNAEGIYPWHRYRSVTRSIFLGIEI